MLICVAFAAGDDAAAATIAARSDILDLLGRLLLDESRLHSITGENAAQHFKKKRDIDMVRAKYTNRMLKLNFDV